MKYIIIAGLFIAAFAGCKIDRNEPSPVGNGTCGVEYDACVETGANPSEATDMDTFVSGSVSETDGADGMTAGMTAGMTGADTSGSTTSTSGDPTTASTTLTTSADVTGSDSSSTGDPGNDCADGDWAHYTCQGWIAGVYANVPVNPKNYQFVFGATTHAECVTIPICEPFAGLEDSEFLFQRCKAACDAMVENGDLPVVPFPATGAPGSPWTLQDTVCVFAPNGNNAVIPNPTDGVTNTPSALPAFRDSCDSIDPVNAPEIQQVVYEGCFDNDVCAVEYDACIGWNPGSKITSSLNTATRTYTTTIKRSFIASLQGGEYSCVYSENEGMWTYTAVPSPMRWKFKGLRTQDLYYKMGFRNDDWDVKIRRNVAGSTWYSLSSFNGMGDAYDAFNPGVTSFVITFKRGTQTFTMNLTFVT